MIVYASKGPTGHGCTPLDYAILTAIIGAVGDATALALRAVGPPKLMLRETGIEVSTRIPGILVAAIAVGTTVDGIRQCFPVLAHG